MTAFTEFGKGMHKTVIQKGEYYELVEAVRYGRCLQFHPDHHKKLDTAYTNRDWAVPSYDITGIFKTISEDDIQSFFLRSIEYVNSSVFVLPHPAFVLIMQDGKKTVATYVAQDFLTLSASELFLDIDIINHANYVADVWQLTEHKGIWQREVSILGPGFYVLDGSVQEHVDVEYEQERRRAADVIVSKIAGFLLMLSFRRPIPLLRYDIDATNQKLAAVNTGRSLAKTLNKRTSIPPTQKVLYVSKEPITEIILSSARSNNTGTPKAPHDRAGHLRWIKGRDEPIIVRPSKIRGGSLGMPPTITVKTRS